MKSYVKGVGEKRVGSNGLFFPLENYCRKFVCQRIGRLSCHYLQLCCIPPHNLM